MSPLLFDLFGFRFGSREAEHEIIGIPTIPEPPVVCVLGVVRRESLGLSSHSLGSLLLPLFEQAFGPAEEFSVLLVGSSLVTCVVVWDEHGFDKGIKLIEQDVGENRADHRALWDSAQGLLVFPLFQVPCVKQLSQ